MIFLIPIVFQGKSVLFFYSMGFFSHIFDFIKKIKTLLTITFLLSFPLFFSIGLNSALSLQPSFPCQPKSPLISDKSLKIPIQPFLLAFYGFHYKPSNEVFLPSFPLVLKTFSLFECLFGAVETSKFKKGSGLDGVY